MSAQECRDIEVDKLKIDRAYQRPANDERVRRMARDFDPLLVGAIVVSFRDGYYWCVTGQHRMLAARTAGIRTLPAVILYGLTAKDEARIFRKNATSTKAVGPLDQHRSALFEEDSTALAVETAMREHGFRLGHSGFRSVTRAYTLWRQGTLGDVLEIINGAWLREGEPMYGAVGNPVLRALGDFFERFPGADRPRVIQACQKIKPTDLIMPHGHPRGAVDAWQLVMGIYNRGLRQNKLEVA